MLKFFLVKHHKNKRLENDKVLKWKRLILDWCSKCPFFGIKLQTYCLPDFLFFSDFEEELIVVTKNKVGYESEKSIFAF